ncbi:unnamed protein product [Lactuca saligna]|uniref:Uncharacterized protein n=1 Tax=Lactuca saligna TaxID=75948 RepID=A0AA35VRV9_LACSI|nr:unnamed protein product [Lactuca saligna]
MESRIPIMLEWNMNIFSLIYSLDLFPQKLMLEEQTTKFEWRLLATLFFYNAQRDSSPKEPHVASPLAPISGLAPPLVLSRHLVIGRRFSSAIARTILDVIATHCLCLSESLTISLCNVIGSVNGLICFTTSSWTLLQCVRSFGWKALCDVEGKRSPE